MKKILKTIALLFIPFTLSAQNYYGGIPALFEDFAYTNSQFPIDGDSSNSLYGKNIWLTENGTISSRAWHRYNWGDGVVFGEHSSIEPTAQGIAFKVSEGFKFSDVPPVLKSGFVFKHGTFVSRIRCGSLAPDTRSIQAFWLFSPDHYRFKSGNDSITYYHEVNYEWNNWFFGAGEKRMTANTIWAATTKKGLYSSVREMNFFKRKSGIFTALPTKTDNSKEYYTENKWFYYLIRLDSTRQVAEFLTEEDTEADGKIYGGQSVENGVVLPVSHSSNFPRTALLTMYNYGIGSMTDDSINHYNVQMDVDWFYYTPDATISISDAAREVRALKDQGISRMNTTGEQLSHDSLAHWGPPSVTIDGPDEVNPLELQTWTVRPSIKNTVYDIEYMYRRYSPSGHSEWTTIDTPEGRMYAHASDTAIELRATVKDWRGQIASAIKFVKVKPFILNSVTEVFPNPTSSLVVVVLPDSFKKHGLRICIYSITGKKYSEYASQEQKFATIDLNNLPEGQYLLVISAGDEILKRSVTFMR